MRFLICGCCLLSVLLTGCKTPAPPPLVTPTPPSFGALHAASAERPFPREWWLAFQDEELNRLIGLARADNRDLAQASARIDAAIARAKIAGAEAALAVSATGGASRRRTSENVPPQLGANHLTTFSGELGFSYEVDLWGRVRASRMAAEKEVELSLEERAALDISLAAHVAKRHLTRLAVQREAATVNALIDRYDETAKLQAARVDAGFATELDLQRVRAEKASREGELAQLREREKALANELALLCGQTTPPPDVVSTPREALLPEVSQPFSLALLEARPDVAARRSKWDASLQRVQEARAAFYPAVRLAGTFGHAAEHPEDLLDWRSRLWSLVGNLTAPVLDGGRLKGNLELASAQLREAAAAYESAVLTAYREVADALNTLQALSQRHAAAEATRVAAARALDLSRERYDKGFVTFLEVVESDRALLDAQRTLAQIQAGRQNATVDLIRALGIP